MAFFDWLKLYKVWIAISAGIFVAGGTIAGISIANKRENARKLAELQTLETQATPSAELLATATPELTPSSNSTVTATPKSKSSSKPTASASSTPTPTATPASTATPTPTPTPTPTATPNATVIWTDDGSSWKPSSTAPSCPSPFTFTSPVDLSAATSILYPGQERGGDYKPHGGFRFNNSTDGAITVRAPYAGRIVKASRYLESNEVQYLFEFQHSCGIAWRFDHLNTLSSALQSVADKLPEAKADDTRTTDISPPVEISAGATLGTKIGVTGNTFVDWGVYDLRNKNGITKSNNTLASYGVCWFDWLSASDEATVRGLPATADNNSSDYCK